jgi:hypothetical protein
MAQNVPERPGIRGVINHKQQIHTKRVLVMGRVFFLRILRTLMHQPRTRRALKNTRPLHSDAASWPQTIDRSTELSKNRRTEHLPKTSRQTFNLNI